MENKTVKMKKLYEVNSGERNDKYMKEYNLLINKILLVEKEETFPLLVKLMRLCSKLHICLPSEYTKYYLQKKVQLKTELRNIDRKIMLSQINNENYSHLEKRKELISTTLGINTN